MKRINTTILGAIIPVILVACADSSSNNNSTNTTQDNEAVNPLDRSRPIARETSFVFQTTPGEMWQLDVDPSAGTYQVKSIYREENNQTVVATGTYNADTGAFSDLNCVNPVVNYECEGLWYDYFSNLDTSKFIGDGRVLLYPVGINPSYIGVDPTTNDQMAKMSKTVSYEGDFYLNNSGEFSSQGKAVSTVNFDTSKMNVDFSNFDGQMAGSSLKFSDINVTGGKFSGGNQAFIDEEGTKYLTDNIPDIEGRFFGNNAEELGGVFNMKAYADGGPSWFFNGAWNGER